MSDTDAPDVGALGAMFAGWEPHTVVESDQVSSGAALALHGLLEGSGAAPADGEELPVLWHWLAFLPRVPQSEIGGDGHPRPGSLLPPVALPRRMFAGARVSVRHPLRVGAALTRSGVVTAVQQKHGRSGELCFVTVAYEISDGLGGEIREEQDIVYRGAAAPGGIGASPLAEPATVSSLGPPTLGAGARAELGADPSAVGSESGEPWALDVNMTSTLLFRFSALTYNAHRIHYDRDFARDVEGYPGLVVHGPLQAVLLVELCRRAATDLRVERFSFQAKSPAFEGATMTFRGRPAARGEVSLEARDEHGSVTMVADAALAAPGVPGAPVL